jgi:hypothetical protein
MALDGCGFSDHNYRQNMGLLSVNPVPIDHMAAKFARIWRPTFWLFSGWNWVARRLSRQMLLTKSPP